VNAQATEKIHTIEYFFDTDPGFGNASQIKVTPSNTQVNALTFNAPIGTLSNGLHQLFVRCLDSSYRWSSTTSRLFYKEAVVTKTTPKIAAAEYFFNTDPGFGNGSVATVATNNDVTFTINGDINSLPKGLNTIYIRTRDSEGNWSHTKAELFYREPVISNPIPNVTGAEYFFDIDPGFGNGTTATVTPGKDINFSISGDIAALNKGFHTFYVRVKDGNNNWSLTHTQLFYKEPVVSTSTPTITKAEYFFDTDPGFGSGTPVTVTPGKDINFAINGDIAALGKGLHTLYVRVKDANNSWSLTNSQLFYKELVVSTSIPNITQAEYFFDTDPGFGSGTAFGISPQGQDITQAIDLPATGLNKGFHRLYTRVKDANGKWSITNTSLFYYESIVTTPALGNLITLEWFWNTDPGFGNANKVSLPANNNGQLTDFVFNVPVSDEFNNSKQHLYIRTLDANWSLTTVILADFTGISLPVTLLEFTARANKQNVLTNWRTTQEINLKNFIVEHSVDGLHFSAVGTVSAKGSGSVESKYEFVHTNPSAGANYYRLKQVDNDGKFTYSPVVKITYTSGNQQPIAYPNPVKNNLTLAIPNELFSNDKLQLMILDSRNSLVKKQNLSQATTQIQFDNLASGTYWLVLIDQKGNKVWTTTVIKE
jgi:hypothetical protein